MHMNGGKYADIKLFWMMDDKQDDCVSVRLCR